MPPMLWARDSMLAFSSPSGCTAASMKSGRLRRRQGCRVGARARVAAAAAAGDEERQSGDGQDEGGEARGLHRAGILAMRLDQITRP